MTPHDDLEGGRGAGAGAGNQFGIGAGIGARPHGRPEIPVLVHIAEFLTIGRHSSEKVTVDRGAYPAAVPRRVPNHA
ncbi:protein of unknown function (plasmid) [Cupriavidus neocaledonicus]|uniref:Uncharacterized protein n=1 Tax=Cupriavidus neocaledonicus TaxID=1040979 RepID=A0A375HLV4_9BURK|nr:hypothetical protein CBM2605_B130408 [Cupriavidus neocaledonicus]SPD59219.1 protein of unknown function [Cupriavidus neocaledonicus]